MIHFSDTLTSKFDAFIPKKPLVSLDVAFSLKMYIRYYKDKD